MRKGEEGGGKEGRGEEERGGKGGEGGRDGEEGGRRREGRGGRRREGGTPREGREEEESIVLMLDTFSIWCSKCPIKSTEVKLHIKTWHCTCRCTQNMSGLLHMYIFVH